MNAAVTPMKNWGGNVTFAAEHVARPATLAVAQELIAAAPRARALGSRHSFSHIADAPVIIDASLLPEIFEPVSYTHLTLPTNREV